MLWKIILFFLPMKFFANFSNLSSLASAEYSFWNTCNVSLILDRGFSGLTISFFRKKFNPNKE